MLVLVLQTLQALLFHPTDATPLAVEVVPSVQVRCHLAVLPGKPWDLLLFAQHSTAACSCSTSQSVAVLFGDLCQHEVHLQLHVIRLPL